MVRRQGLATKIHYGWVVISLGLLVTTGAHGFGRMAYTLILPEMGKGLGITFTQVGLLQAGNMAGYLLFALVGGMLASMYGSRIVITLSLMLMGITMLLTGMASSFKFALIMRLFTGIGNGGAYVVAVALGTSWFAMQRRGFATGIVTGGIGAGTLLSGIIVPAIFRIYGARGWPLAWYYLGGLILIIAVVCGIFLRNRPADLGLSLVGSERKNVLSKTMVRSKAGNLQWGLIYGVKEVWYIGIVYFMYGFSYVIYMTYFKAFLLDAGVADAQASMMWALAGGVSIFCGVIWGSISDVLGRGKGAALAYLTLALSYLIFAVFNSQGAFYVSTVLFGLSAWSIPTIMGAAVGDHVGPDLAQAGVGFVTLFFGLGQVFGPVLGGYLRDATGAFGISFIVAAAVSLLGLFGSLLLLKKNRTEALPGTEMKKA